MTKVLGSGLSPDNESLVVSSLTMKTNRSLSEIVIPEAAGDTISEYIRAPFDGAVVSRITVRTIDGVSTTAGTYTLACDKEKNGGATANQLSTSTVTLEGIADQTDIDLTLTATTDDLVFVDGHYFKVTVASDNADLSGGAGVVVSVVWDVDTTSTTGTALTDIDWIVLTASDITATVDPNSLGDGAITMDGDYLQIPVDSIRNNTDQFNESYLLYFDSFSTLTDANGYPTGRLFFEITLGTAMTDQFLVAVGIIEKTPKWGLAHGLEKGPGNYFISSTGDVNLQRDNITGTPGSVVGSVEGWGKFDGVSDSCLLANGVYIPSGSTEAGGAKARSRQGTTTDIADMTSLVMIGHDGTSPTGGEVLDVRIRYAWVENAFPVPP